MFKFSQSTLLKVRKIRADQALQAFALSQRRVIECQQAIEHNAATIVSIENDMVAKLESGVKAQELQRLEEYHVGLRVRDLELRQALNEAEASAEERRQELLKAKTDLRAMERLREIELARYRAEIERQEMLFIDEIAVTRHGKNL